MSHVAMGKHICQVCGIEFESGEILLHKQLRDIPEDKTVTGFGLCDEHTKLLNDGYIAFVEADEKKSTFLDNGNMSQNGAWRTGRCMHIKRELASEIFNCELDPKLPMVFIDIEAFNQVMVMTGQEA